MRGYRECQAYIHSTGVMFNRSVDIFHDLRGDKKREFTLSEQIEEITIKYVGAKNEG